MLKIRYANYPKDYFMGILPSSQYGSVAVLPSVVDGSRISSQILAYNTASTSPVSNPVGGTSVVTIDSKRNGGAKDG